MGLIGYFSNPNSYTSDEYLKRDLNEINKIWVTKFRVGNSKL